jgi:hypothetical protein
MKLIDHVLKIRSIIAQAISNRFERLGLTAQQEVPVEGLSAEDAALRTRLKAVIDYHAADSEYADARKLAVNECTFTLFNRLAAIKVMEDKEFQPEIIMRRPEHGGRSFEHNAWLENNLTAETRSARACCLSSNIASLRWRSSIRFSVPTILTPSCLWWTSSTRLSMRSTK